MTAMPTAEAVTAQRYMNMRELDGRRTNLVDGEVVMGEAVWEHQAITGSIFRAMSDWVEAGERRGAASLPIDVYVDEHNVYAPDVLWYSQERIPPNPRARPQAVPDLAVEVRSPSTWRYDVGAKKSGYERAGAPELWLVDTPARAVLAFRRSSRDAGFDLALELAAGDVLESPLLERFALPLDQLFAG
jgi:Uma2 family endonuclease